MSQGGRRRLRISLARRFRHLNNKSIQLMEKKEMVRGIPKLRDEAKVCTVGNVGKEQRVKFPKKSN